MDVKGDERLLASHNLEPQEAISSPVIICWQFMKIVQVGGCKTAHGGNSSPLLQHAFPLAMQINPVSTSCRISPCSYILVRLLNQLVWMRDKNCTESQLEEI